MWCFPKWGHYLDFFFKIRPYVPTGLGLGLYFTTASITSPAQNFPHTRPGLQHQCHRWIFSGQVGNKPQSQHDSQASADWIELQHLNVLNLWNLKIWLHKSLVMQMLKVHVPCCIRWIGQPNEEKSLVYLILRVQKDGPIRAALCPVFKLLLMRDFHS